jgi:transketolase
MIIKDIRQQFADTMLDVGKKDENLVVLVGDISHFKLQPFAKTCPKRFYNIGICEQAMVSIGAGLAKLNFNPVLHTIAPFLLERAFEQIKLDFCYHQLGGNFVTVGGVFDYSNLGCTHHCYDDFALLKTLPGSQILHPASAIEFDTLFKQNYDNEFVTLYRIPSKGHGFDFKTDEIQTGKAIKVNDGKEITIIVTGTQLRNVIDVCKCESISADILYIHTIQPLDKEAIIKSVEKTKKVLVVEEHMEKGGLGDDVLREIHELQNFSFKSLSIPNKFVTGYGTYEEHCESVGLNKEGILQSIKAILFKI